MSLQRLALATLCVTAACAYAEPNLRIDGSLPGFVPIYASNAITGARISELKPVTFQRIVLSPESQQYLMQKLLQPVATATPTDLPSKINLSMNKVPVLDQGQHGTCVTFADTGALDAMHGNTDYISQLCNLELGNALSQQNPDYPSGWDGSFSTIVLTQIAKYGIINMDYQHQYGCSGLTAYPTNDPTNTGAPLDVQTFAEHSEAIMNNVKTSTILDPENALTPRADSAAVLEEVKRSLAQGNRVVFGVLVDTNYHNNGTYGTFVKNKDSWIITPEIQRDLDNDNIHAGHEMIITGYDDNATIKGPDQTLHQGVLTLRNSWGPRAGNAGNYYMSYEYFQKLAIEVIAIAKQ